MSLFIGNLSSHVRQDDLENVFRKFGRCNLQVKDNFGFVDYDYPVNAEKALKMLRGKRICGQLLTLSWSNKQPKLSLRPRGVNFYESHHGRNFHESHHGRNFHESHHERNFGESQHGRNLPESQHEKDLHESQHGRNLRESQYERNLNESHYRRNLPESHQGRNNRKQTYVKKKFPLKGQMGYKKPVPDGRVFHPTDKPEDASNCDFKNTEIYGMKKKRADAKGEGNFYDLLPNRNKLGNGSEFDRYEPDSSDDKRNHEVHRSQERENGKMKRIRKSQNPESQSPERLRARKLRKTMSSPSCSGDKVSGSNSNSIYSKSTTKFASNSNSRSRSLSSSSTFSSKLDSHRSRDHMSKSVSRSRSHSCASLDVYTSSGRSSTPPTKSYRGKNNSFTNSERNEVQIRSKSSSKSRSSSRASLYVSTPSGRSSTPPTKSHNGKNYSFISSERNEVQIISAPLVENGNEVLQSQKSEKDTRLPENGGLTEEVLSPSNHKGTRDLQICNFNISKVGSRSHKTMKSLLMTSEEILMVLKHYGLKQPEDVDDKDLPVESFWGCARLWPSEVVYYRRLKKGYISTENYARRIFQNKEFGIVDNYVRSSSGWSEDTCTW